MGFFKDTVSSLKKSFKMKHCQTIMFISGDPEEINRWVSIVAQNTKKPVKINLEKGKGVLYLDNTCQDSYTKVVCWIMGHGVPSDEWQWLTSKGILLEKELRRFQLETKRLR